MLPVYSSNFCIVRWIYGHWREHDDRTNIEVIVIRREWGHWGQGIELKIVAFSKGYEIEEWIFPGGLMWEAEIKWVWCCKVVKVLTKGLLLEMFNLLFPKMQPNLLNVSSVCCFYFRFPAFVIFLISQVIKIFATGSLGGECGQQMVMSEKDLLTFVNSSVLEELKLEGPWWSRLWW